MTQVIERQSPEPFIIRGHHVLSSPLLTEAIEFPMEIEALVIQGTETLFSERGEYSYDLFGDDPLRYIPKYNRLISRFVNDFMNLLDSDPIHITKGKDGICTACAIGKHCSEVIDQDQKDLEEFGQAAGWLGFKEGEDFSNIAEGGKIIRIETTKKTVVDIVASFQDYFDALSIMSQTRIKSSK